MQGTFFISIFVLLSTISILMAEESNQYIVHVNRPVEEEPEAFDIRTLAAVVGSEDAAKEALIYHYKVATSGFCAMLTPQQVADLSQKPEVVLVVPSGKVYLFSIM